MWLVDRMFEVLKTAWNGERICSNDIFFIFLHFLGQCDETKVITVPAFVSRREDAKFHETSLQVFFLFTLFDKNDSGNLTCAELREVLTDTMTENGVIFDDDEIRQLVGVLIEECIGPGKCTSSTKIEYQDMRRLLDNQRGLAESLASRCAFPCYVTDSDVNFQLMSS